MDLDSASAKHYTVKSNDSFVVTNMEEPRHINITADKENPDDDLQKILKEIRPNWSEKDVTLEVISE